MGLTDDERRRGEATTSACSCCGNDEASGASALRRQDRPAAGPGWQRKCTGDNSHSHSHSRYQHPDLPSHQLPSHHQQLPLLGPPSRRHQALASSTRNVDFALDLGSGNGSHSRGASSRLQPTAPNPDDEGQRAALDFRSSSKPTLAFAVVQQHQTDLFSLAPTTPSALPGLQFDDIDDTGSASQLSLVTSSCSSQPGSFPSTQGSVRMAVAANAVAPQSLSFDSYYSHHLSGHMPAMSANTDLPILNAEQYDLMGSYGMSKPNVTRKKLRTTNSTLTTGKRSRPTDHAYGAGEDGGDLDEDEGRRKRSRGRPRLDTKDETAADVSRSR